MSFEYINHRFPHSEFDLDTDSQTNLIVLMHRVIHNSWTRRFMSPELSATIWGRHPIVLIKAFKERYVY